MLRCQTWTLIPSSEGNASCLWRARGGSRGAGARRQWRSAPPCFGVPLPVVRKEREGCVEAMRYDVTCVGGGFAKLWVLRDSRVHGAEWFQPPEKSLYTSTTHALEYLLIIIKWCSGHVSWKKKITLL